VGRDATVRGAARASGCALAILRHSDARRRGELSLSDTPALTSLSNWARSETPLDAVFLFPAAGHGLEPGVFRTAALRAVYVDWKGGGQVNYQRDFATEWWFRWQQTMQGFHAEDLPEIRSVWHPLRSTANQGPIAAGAHFSKPSIRGLQIEPPAALGALLPPPRTQKPRNISRPTTIEFDGIADVSGVG